MGSSLGSTLATKFSSSTYFDGRLDWLDDGGLPGLGALPELGRGAPGAGPAGALELARVLGGRALALLALGLDPDGLELFEDVADGVLLALQVAVDHDDAVLLVLLRLLVGEERA